MFVDSSCALREIGKNENHEHDYRCNVERQLTSSTLQKIVNATLIVRIHGGPKLNPALQSWPSTSALTCLGRQVQLKKIGPAAFAGKPTQF